MEIIPSTESMSQEKQELLDLEKQGNFVFHGTGQEVEMLEPRQAIDLEKGPDGEPAIFASPAADFAIFHAIINSNNFPNGIRSESGAVDHDDGTFDLKFGLPEGSLDDLPETASGWVYVFRKEDFEGIDGRLAEVRSRASIKPVQKIRVLKRDLPSYIDKI